MAVQAVVVPTALEFGKIPRSGMVGTTEHAIEGAHTLSRTQIPIIMHAKGAAGKNGRAHPSMHTP